MPEHYYETEKSPSPIHNHLLAHNRADAIVEAERHGALVVYEESSPGRLTVVWRKSPDAPLRR